MRELEELVRKNILRLNTCRLYNREKELNCKILLNSNENPYNQPNNRYPDPMQTELKKQISLTRRVHTESIFIGNGISEVVDTVFRCFCEPGRDNVVAISPTDPAFKSFADINDVEYISVPLCDGFNLNANDILNACNCHTKVVWLCSPNNPTGNDLNREEIISVINNFSGIVVVDEAYADFSRAIPLRHELYKYPNLIVMDTFSHAWGCAALRIGMAYSAPVIINLFNNIKYPYSIPLPSQKIMISELKKMYEVDKWIKIILMERDRMMEAFSLLPDCEKIFHSAANFFLVRMKDAETTYNYLLDHGIAVENVSHNEGCSNCIRITVGSKTENAALLAALRK